jgi:tRNA(Ile)-lysidine synthase
VSRRHSALRAWLRELGLRMPSEAKLREMERQLVESHGAYGRVLHEGRALVRDREDVHALDVAELARAPVPQLELRWRQEPWIELPVGHGRLLFEAVAPGDSDGVSARWLAAQALTVSPGGASSTRMRPHRGAHRRTLKNLYQERGVPARERPRLPLVHVHGRLLFAGAIGMDHDDDWPRDGPCVRLRWEPAAGRADVLRGSRAMDS